MAVLSSSNTFLMVVRAPQVGVVGHILDDEENDLFCLFFGLGLM